MVFAAQPLAVQAGLEILKKGGSAVDAAIAVNACLGLMEPTANGMGGDLFAIVWDPRTKKLHGLNASGRAPLGLTAEQLPLAELLEPAARYAEEGFPVSPVIASDWARSVKRFADKPGFRDVFMPGG